MAGAPKKRAVKKPPVKKKASAKEPTKSPPRSRPGAPKAAAVKAARRTTQPRKKPASKKAAAAARQRRAERAPARRAKADEKKREQEAKAATQRETERRRGAKRPPSERVLAVFAELPTERPLTDEEREAMAKVSETARQFIGAEGSPSRIVERIAEFVEEVRQGRREEPKSQDVRLGLGVLWGEQVKTLAGWSWVHLTYPDGFASYALVPDDRSFACFPLNRLPEAFRPNTTHTSLRVFDSIRNDALPARKPNAYLVIG